MKAGEVALRLDAGTRNEVRLGLRQGMGALIRGDLESGGAHIEAAHSQSQNSASLHTLAHGALLALRLAEGRPGALVRELPHLWMAAPASWVRRASGLAPGVPGGRGLWDTWRRREELQAAGRAG